MQAILIKYLPATDTRGVRLKVWAFGVKPMTEARDDSIDCELQAKGLAERFIQHHWGKSSYYGFGCLPNGDYVATLGE